MTVATLGPCQDTPSFPCQFSPEERVELHAIASRVSYVAFPKWALTLTIALFAMLFGSQVALWLELSSKSPLVDSVSIRERLAKIEASTPKEFPPAWFSKQFDEVVRQGNENNRLLQDLRVEVRALVYDRAEMNKVKGGLPNNPTGP